MSKWDKAKNSVKFKGPSIELYKNDGLRYCLFEFVDVSKEKGFLCTLSVKAKSSSSKQGPQTSKP